LVVKTGIEIGYFRQTRIHGYEIHKIEENPIPNIGQIGASWVEETAYLRLREMS
jgi:hypothetical protein